MSEKGRKSFGDFPLRYDRERAPALPDGKTGIHSVDAANEIAQEIIDAHARAERAIEDSLVDKLTNCYNQNYWMKYVNENFNPRRDSGKVGLVFVDLNNLGEINKKLSHAAGNQLLVDTAELLRSSVRKSDVVVRVGGDEFVVVCYNDVADDDFAVNLATAIKGRGVEHPTADFAVGVAVYDETHDESSLVNTLARASVKMYEHKDKVKGIA